MAETGYTIFIERFTEPEFQDELKYWVDAIGVDNFIAMRSNTFIMKNLTKPEFKNALRHWRAELGLEKFIQLMRGWN